jgi:hypothetical protein
MCEATTIATLGLIIAAGGAAYGAYSSIEQAEKQNEAIENQLRQARENMASKTALAESEEAMIEAQALENRDILAKQEARNAARARGTARASFSNSTIGLTSGAPMAVVENIQTQTTENQALASIQAGREMYGAKRARAGETISAMSEYDSVRLQALAGVRNGLMDAIGGGLSGLGTGLSIASSGLSMYGNYKGMKEKGW